MKKILSLFLVVAFALSSAGSALALNFTGELGNEATFETLQEAHASAPDVVKNIMENGAKTFVGHPALDAYPEGTTYVYRSANQYAGRAAARLNSNIFVYADKHFASKDEALAYLKDMGVIDIMDEATGSVVLVTPIGETFTQADVAAYYALQTAMLAQKAGGSDAEGNPVSYADAEYFGGYGYVYFVGVEGGAPFSGYNFDEAPYSLCDRNILINGRTADGICLITHQGDDDRFAQFKTSDVVNADGSVTAGGEYIDVWYEYLPEEVLMNTAPAGTIPLILANHGGGDDARVFVEEFGLLELAGQERVAVVAPDHQLIAEVRGPALTAVVEYMLETYPALDASRVYATGFSMGGAATYTVGYYNPKLFAAVAPMSGSPTVIPEDQAANFASVELPVFFSLSSFDGVRRMDALEGNISEVEQQMVTFWAKNNGIDVTAFDFEKYPHLGFGGDVVVDDRVNDEFDKHTVYLNNANGEQRVAFAYVQGMIHALYPEYAFMMWDFVKDYSRDLETGAVIYTPDIW